MAQSPLEQPRMESIAGRPIKVLYAPHADIMIAARTADGEDVHVPVAAILEMFATEIVKRVRNAGGNGHGSH